MRKIQLNKNKNLTLSTETIRQLHNSQLNAVSGGRYYPETVASCISQCMCASVVADPEPA